MPFNVKRYILVSMIKSFKDKEVRSLFERCYSHKFPKNIHLIAHRKLRMLNNSKLLTDIKTPPNNKFKVEKGRRIGQYSININDTWKICFKLVAGKIEAVQIISEK